MEKYIGDRISTYVDKKYTSIIVFPERKRWKEALLFAWVIGFTIAGMYMIYLFFGGLNTIDNTGLDGSLVDIKRDQKIFTGVFIMFWAYFEYQVVKGLLWVVLGKELIRVNDDSLNIKNSIMTYGKSKRFFHENIKDMDLINQEEMSFSFNYENAFWRKGTDSIAFSHKSKTVSFGRKLNNKDARLLHRFIQGRIKKHSKS
jgi:hypothetical protein